MARRWWLGIVVVFLFSSILFARQGSITTRDGRTVVGDITEDQGTATRPTVTITVHGITAEVDRSTVTSIVYADEFGPEFHKRLAAMDAKDIAGRLELARWALSNQQYDLARHAATEAQGIDPNSSAARTLLETIQNQQVLEAKPATPATPKPVPTPVAPAPAPKPVAVTAPDARFITADDINAIRQQELRPDDAGVHLQFLNDVRKRYVAASGIDGPEFDGRSQVEQAVAIIKNGDAKMLKDVRIIGDPAALAEYHVRVQPRILAGCAASNCHGGAKAGSFFLFNNSADNSAAWYTNFYILTAYKSHVNSNDAFGKGQVSIPVIDRIHPSASLLIQYGLPQSSAANPHPKVDGFRTVYSSDRDPFYQGVISWMGSSLNPLEPDFTINFTLPTGKSATTQPAKNP